jgi:hypothetical protein
MIGSGPRQPHELAAPRLCSLTPGGDAVPDKLSVTLPSFLLATILVLGGKTVTTIPTDPCLPPKSSAC